MVGASSIRNDSLSVVSSTAHARASLDSAASYAAMQISSVRIPTTRSWLTTGSARIERSSIM